jgi:hypothetical protein
LNYNKAILFFPVPIVEPEKTLPTVAVDVDVVQVEAAAVAVDVDVDVEGSPRRGRSKKTEILPEVSSKLDKFCQGILTVDILVLTNLNQLLLILKI